MSDISNREDIEKLVNTFYGNVKKTPFLVPIFDMPESEWERHLPVMYNFWDNMVFQTGSYTGGMMWVHFQVNEKHRLSPEHFEHWLSIFFGTVNLLFEGPNAEFVKNKALEVGQIMNAKLQHINQQKS
jgi:hemoglobin